MENVKLSINGMEMEVPSNYTVLEAAKEAGIHIPTLCYLKDLNEVGACRVCVVEVEGARTLQASCVLPVREGMAVKTNTKRVRESQKTTTELLLANHNRECLTCYRSKNCELQNLSEELGIEEVSFEGAKRDVPVDSASTSIVRDASKCILCGRCVSACKKTQGLTVLDFQNRGFDTTVGPAFDVSMNDAPCVYCGQCMIVCPVAALREKTDIERVWEAIEDPEIHVVAQTAPAVRAALGEEFGMPIGTRVTGKMVAAIRRLGVSRIYDTDFGADLTIMEEGHELLHRIKNGGKLPMITSCSPGWIRHAEFNHPDFLENLSSCKSPAHMFGAITKSYYAEKNNIDPSKIFVLSFMPCTSKKSEAAREEMEVGGRRDVDAVITTRELGKMIKQARLDFVNLPDEDFDRDYLGDYTGAGVIFGATGGVMEAALRTVADVLTGEDLADFEYHGVRGIDGIKESTVKIGDMEINVALAHSTGQATKLLDMVRSGEKDYHFIEIMGCSGGCVCGGGQPQQPADVLNSGIDIRVERAKALYEEDTVKAIRKSHQNPMIQDLYKNFLGEPNSHKAHELLHTHYTARDAFVKK